MQPGIELVPHHEDMKEHKGKPSWFIAPQLENRQQTSRRFGKAPGGLERTFGTIFSQQRIYREEAKHAKDFLGSLGVLHDCTVQFPGFEHP